MPKRYFEKPADSDRRPFLRTSAETLLRTLVPSAYNRPSNRRRFGTFGRSQRWITWRPRPRRSWSCARHATIMLTTNLAFWQKYIFSQDHKVIGIQYAITGLAVPAVRFHSDDDHAVAAGLSGPADSADRQPVQRGAGARRHHAARVLQPARGDARHHHGVPRRRAARRRRLRQLRDAAADRRARHGVPQAQHGELLGVLPGRRH